MANNLTSEQLQTLQELSAQGNISSGYYTTLASYRVQYGNLALSVVNPVSLGGQVAQYYLQQVAGELGVTIGNSQIQQIELGLMRADFAARMNARGADLGYSQIEAYHAAVFKEYGLPITACTAYAPVQIYGESEWERILDTPGSNLASSGIFALMMSQTVAIGEGVARPLTSNEQLAFDWVGNVMACVTSNRILFSGIPSSWSEITATPEAGNSDVNFTSGDPTIGALLVGSPVDIQDDVVLERASSWTTSITFVDGSQTASFDDGSKSGTLVNVLNAASQALASHFSTRPAGDIFDFIQGGPGDYTLDASGGNLTIVAGNDEIATGGSGKNVPVATGATDAISVSTAGQSLIVYGASDVVNGNGSALIAEQVTSMIGSVAMNGAVDAPVADFGNGMMASDGVNSTFGINNPPQDQSVVDLIWANGGNDNLNITTANGFGVDIYEANDRGMFFALGPQFRRGRAAPKRSSANE